MMLSRTLPLAAVLLLAGGASIAEEATDAQVRKVEVRKIVLAHGEGDDVAKTGVFVKRIQDNGDAPNTFVQVLGSDSEAIDIDDLADGETRSFELGDGKWMDVTRVGEMLTLDVDGKEIQVPLNPADNMMLAGLPGLAGLAGLGDEHVEVMMMTGDDMPEHAHGAHRMMFISDDGAVQELSGEGNFEWTSEHGEGVHGLMFIGEDGEMTQIPMDGSHQWTPDGNMAIAGTSRIIVKRIGHEGADGENVQVMALPAFPLHGLGEHPNLDELDALKDADPEVRAKVLEALHEILGKHHAVQLDVDVKLDDAHAGPDGKLMRVRRVAKPASVQEH
jgi:hypothetical protein